jgi:polyferredoxin
VQLGAGLFWLSLPLTGALQIDLPHLRVLVLGRTWPPLTPDLLPAEALQRGAAPHWELIGPALAWTILPVAGLAIAFLLGARYFGRLHCGFTCFYGLMAETGEAFWRWARRPGDLKPLRVALFAIAVALAAPAMAFEILSLVATPRGVAAGLAARDMAIAVPFAVLTALALVMGLFVRLRFCRYVCGVGLLQSAAWMTNPKALQMGFHPAPGPNHGSMRDCTGCHGCRDVCPIGFDPRAPKRSMMACFQCGLCLERCEDELHPLGKGAAIGLHLADPGFPLTPHAPSLVDMAKRRAP